MEAGVLIIGAGGLGCPAALALAAGGARRIGVVDDDRVDASNLHRQVLFADADVGELKVVAFARALSRRFPALDVEPHAVRFDVSRARALVAAYDVVIDGSDNFATRLAVADAARALMVPLVSAAVGQFDGQLGVFRGWEQDKPCYRCLVGHDPDRADTSCADQGVVGALTGVMGSLAAIEAIRAIVPFGADPAGTLLMVDALNFRFRTIGLPKDPGCGCAGLA